MQLIDLNNVNVLLLFIRILLEKEAPRPGFEPGCPKGLTFQASAIPDYAITASYLGGFTLIFKTFFQL
jgi:hypothetical protein